MTHENLPRIWSDHLDGVPLAHEDEGALMTAYQDEGLVEGLEQDAELDVLLRLAARTTDDGESFVREFERRLAARGDEAIEAPPIADVLVPPPLPCPAPPVASVIIATDRSTIGRKQQRRAERWLIGVTLGICVAVLLAGFVMDRSRRPASRPTGTSERHVVDTEPAPLPDRSIEITDAKDPELPIEDVHGWRHAWSGESARPPDATNRREFEPKTPTAVPAKTETPKYVRPEVPPHLWLVGGPQDERLAPGRHELDQGLAQLKWNGESQLEVHGPAQLQVRDDGSLALDKGRLRVIGESLRDSTSSSANIQTPTSCITSHTGSFDIAVNDLGATDVSLLSGEVELKPVSSADPPNRGLHLVMGRFERAHIEVPVDRGAARPTFSQLTGPGDCFAGLIALDGHTLQFGSVQPFEDFGRQVVNLAERSPDRLIAQWPALVKSLHGVGGVSVAVQGKQGREEFRSLEDLFRMIQSLPSAAGGGFQGSIHLNGQEFRFNSPAEFEAAQKRFLGPLNFFGEKPR